TVRSSGALIAIGAGACARASGTVMAPGADASAATTTVATAAARSELRRGVASDLLLERATALTVTRPSHEGAPCTDAPGQRERPPVQRERRCPARASPVQRARRLLRARVRYRQQAEWPIRLCS